MHANLLCPGGPISDGQISDGETRATRSDSPTTQPRDVGPTRSATTTASGRGYFWIPAVERRQSTWRDDFDIRPRYFEFASYRPRRRTQDHPSGSHRNHVERHTSHSVRNRLSNQQPSTVVLSIAAEFDDVGSESFHRLGDTTSQPYAWTHRHTEAAGAERQRFKNAFRNMWRQRWPLRMRQSDAEAMENIIQDVHKECFGTPPHGNGARRLRRFSAQDRRRLSSADSTIITPGNVPPGDLPDTAPLTRSGATGSDGNPTVIPHVRCHEQSEFLPNDETRASGGSESHVSSLATEACSYPFTTEPVDELHPQNAAAAPREQNFTYLVENSQSYNEQSDFDRHARPNTDCGSSTAARGQEGEAVPEADAVSTPHSLNNQSNSASFQDTVASSNARRVPKYRRTENGDPQNRAPVSNALSQSESKKSGISSSVDCNTPVENESYTVSKNITTTLESTSASKLSYSRLSTYQNRACVTRSSSTSAECSLTANPAYHAAAQAASPLSTRPSFRFSQEPLPTEVILWELQNCFKNIRDLVTCMQPICCCPAIDWLPSNFIKSNFNSSEKERRSSMGGGVSNTSHTKTTEPPPPISDHIEPSKSRDACGDMQDWVAAMNYISLPNVNLIDEDKHMWLGAPFGDVLTQLFLSLLEKYPPGSCHSYIASLDHLADIPLRFGRLRTDVAARYYMLFTVMTTFDHFKDPAVLPPHGSNRKVQLHEIKHLMRRIMGRILVIYAHVFSAHGKTFGEGRERKSLLDCFQYFLRVALGYSILRPNEIFLPQKF